VSSGRFDCAVVGGGVAGLAIAELFARSGRHVVLIERNPKLCLEASASQHGWFHFGSLYSIFPQNQFLRTLVGGVEDLLAYYADFPGMNIRITDGGSLAFPHSDLAWFRDEPIEYIVSARNDPDFDMSAFEGIRSYTRKAFFLLTWELAIKQFISRHQRFYRHRWGGPVSAAEWIAKAGFRDYSRDVITKPNHPGVNLDVDTHVRIVGYDRPMRATSIITQLAQGFLGAGGTLMTERDVERIDTNGPVKRIHTTGGETIEADKVIVAAGRWLRHFLKHEDDLKVVASPLLVAYPAVSDHNFVRMTPFVERSVNHIHHDLDGKSYSLIGGGYFADPNSPAAIDVAKARLQAMALRVFPQLGAARVCESYLGFKTEIVSGSGERNYQYIIREVEDGLFAAVPGKFSLAFSLATNAFKRITGEEPKTSVRLSSPEAAAKFVGLTRHAQVVHDQIF
jgi:glycine/D-amino acid oxidase-like deaminating enzyme